MTRDISPIESLRAKLRGQPPVPAAVLLRQVGVARSNLSRAVVTDGGRTILRLGSARSTRYALRRELKELGSRWPLFLIDGVGRTVRLAELTALEARHWLVSPETPVAEWLARSEEGAGLFADLPWYLQDLRPQGFLGRAFARRHGSALDLPEDPTRWSADHQAIALLRAGDDLPGQLVVGEEAAARAARLEFEVIPGADPGAAYAGLARVALSGTPAGSSAGGEQPKFTAVVDRHGPRHVIVKFALCRTDSGRRWADLLVAEHLAAGLLGESGIPASTTRLIDHDEWRFLEVERADRIGLRGRRSMISLEAVDAEFAGILTSWSISTRKLATAGIITSTSAELAERADAFGAAIENTDRHPGNLAFHFDSGFPGELAPIYDMLPMRFAPGPQGPMPFETQEAPAGLSFPVALADWARERSSAYWRRIAGDARISDAFRDLARRRSSPGPPS